MQVKTFTGWSEKRLDLKVNDFIRNDDIEVIDIKFSMPIFFFSALVMYKDKSFM